MGEVASVMIKLPSQSACCHFQQTFTTWPLVAKSSPPTFYRKLNTFNLAGPLAWTLMFGFVATLLLRRQSQQRAGIASEMAFAVSLLCMELIFYVSGIFENAFT
jgi:hypothetical protein